MFSIRWSTLPSVPLGLLRMQTDPIPTGPTISHLRPLDLGQGTIQDADGQLPALVSNPVN